MAKQKIRIDDIYRFMLVQDPQVDPDGRQVAFLVEWMDKKDETYYTNIYMVGINGRGLKQLTFGKRNDLNPRWSPDGKTLAFIRKKETASQIWTLPMEGGEARPITKLKRGSISDLNLSPNGKTLAFLFHPLGKEVELDKKGKAKTPAYRHYKDIFYRLDGEGYFDSEFTHVWIADAKSGKATQLVEGSYHDMSPCWSADGIEIAFISQRFDDWQLRLDEFEIYRVSLNDGKVKRVKAPNGPKEGLAWSPDGNTLAYLGHQQPYHSWGAINYDLNTISKTGKDHRVYGQKLDRTAYPLTLGDITPSFVITSPVFGTDGKNVYYGISNDGCQAVVYANLDSGAVVPVTEPNAVAATFSLSSTGLKLAYHGAMLDSPDELFCVDLKSMSTTQLTKLNRKYVRSRNFNLAEEVEFRNGRQKLMGWIVKPPGFSPRKKYPFILNIHGGPRCQYGRTFYHEMYVLAANGYVVMYTNPRGSQGYGTKFADTITGKWAEPAMSDLMAAVDYAISLGYVDKNKLGVTGGSYGGYMTNWIVTHTNRFKAAVTQRCVSDMISMFGSSDVGWDISWEFKGPPWEQRDTYQKWSPITYIEKCRTPLLIIHSEGDLRCNIEQGDQMFTSLKYLKREAEYVRFPEEFHGLSRHGRPDRREARLKFIVQWFDKYLKK